MRSCSSKRKSIRARLNDDLVIDILARLPTKSLRRFQCVSKEWRGFISDVSSRRRLLLPMSGLFYYPRFNFSDDQVTYAPISDPQHHHEDDDSYFRGLQSRISTLQLFYSTFDVIHSCNGLLLLTGRDCDDDRMSSYFVYNPATMELVSLPRRSLASSSTRCFLAFDPRVSPHYKVARFTLGINGPIRVIVEMYSSMSGNWVELMSFSRGEGPVCPSVWDSSVFHKGSLYMIANPNHLVRFDVEKGNFQVLTLPKARHEVSFLACIGESRGHLYYAVISHTRPVLRIYLFDEGKAKKWLLKHWPSSKVFDEHPLTRGLSSGISTDEPEPRISPIAFHPDSKVIYLSVPSKILAYHPSSGRLEEICQVADDEDILSWGLVYPVIPCLESINPPGGILIKP